LAIDPHFASLAGIQDQTHISYAFLLKLIGEESMWMTGAQPPIDPSHRIAQLIRSNTKEVYSRAT
jgi:hypothetical protein